MTIGSDLRDARERRGVSLREISERTSIRLPVLRAIENDDFRLVPGSVIMRGFLKLYAREVGLDPDDIGRRYTEQLESAQPASTVEELPTAEREPSAVADDQEGAGGFNRVSVVIAAAAMGVLVGFYVMSQQAPATSSAAAESTRGTVAAAAAPPPLVSEPPKPEPAAGQASTTDSTPSPAPAATTPAGSTRPGASAAESSTMPAASTAAAAAPESPRATSGSASDVLRVDLQATGEVWIAATADGQQVAYRMLSSGERLPIRASREAVLRIGIPANVAISINGQPIRPFARPGTPTTVTITPANYREWLAR